MNTTVTRSAFGCLWLIAFSASSQRVAVAQFMLGDPTIFGAPVETPENELAPELSADGLTLYYQKGNYNDFADLYVATRDSLEGPWKDPQPIVSINTNRHEASPAISPDGRELYFDDGHREGYPSLAQPGGLGGPDIWVSSWNQEDASWRDPQNPGAPVNSAFRDYGPNLSADGLELYFSSDRPGGQGATDLWVTERSTIASPWSEPTNLPIVNGSSHDERPAISPDGRMLIFGSTRSGGAGGPSSLWISTRERIEDDFGPPVFMGKELNGPYWTFDPEFSPDGGTLFYGRYDTGPRNTLWQVALLPLERQLLTPGSKAYQQAFDEALTTDSSIGSALPTGWTTSNSGVIFDNVTTSDFPLRGRLQSGSVFNAGGEEDTDRTLAIGVTGRKKNEAPMIQFLSELDGTEAVALQLEFDLEAWHAEGAADSLGEAAFNISVEVDSGEVFSLLHAFSKSTGTSLTPPEGGGILVGNLDENRAPFDSGAQLAAIPEGSSLRIRWEVPESTDSGGWVFGIDDVKLNLFSSLADAFDCNGDEVLDIADANCSPAVSLDSTLAAANLIRGDADGDRQVQFSDFLVLSSNFGTPGQYTDGDFDGDGEVLFSDFLILSQNFGQSAGGAAAVPEPSSGLLVLLGAVGVIRRRRQSTG